MTNVTPITAAKRRHVAVVKADFHAELKDLKSSNAHPVKCEGQYVKYSEYRIRPTVADAQAMCAGCPMFAGDNLCAEYAVASRADGIVLGGYAWVAGKPVLDDAEAHAEWDDLEDLAA